MNSEILMEHKAIEAVLLGYATVLDGRHWTDLEEVFSADAVADYRGVGVFEGREAIVGVVRDFLEACGPTQHMITNIRVDLEGSTARSSCYLQATHGGISAHAGLTMTVWGEYRDRLERRPEGWRIVHRTLVVQHVAGDVGVALRGETSAA
jgi:3-phenylpropionate/cinnamic acid dioxygenase small subunit